MSTRLPDDGPFEEEDEEAPPLRTILSDRVKLEFVRLRHQALQDLTALRAFEYTGTMLQVGLSITPPPGAEDSVNWQRVHRSTLEHLLQVIISYHRRLYPYAFTAALKHILSVTTALPPLLNFPPPPAEEVTLEEIHNGTAVEYQAASLDIRALEQQSVDMLVSQIYLQPKLKRDEASFVRYVPHLCEHYRTPLFEISQQEFYTLVTTTFETHPARATLFWESSDAIFHAPMPQTMLQYP